VIALNPERSSRSSRSRFKAFAPGTAQSMEGGIAILLIVFLLVVGGFIASGLFGAGGFLWWRKTDPRGDRVEGDDGADRRPRHTTPTTPAQEHTDFVGGKRPGE